jgi:hypothetical protein
MQGFSDGFLFEAAAAAAAARFIFFLSTQNPFPQSVSFYLHFNIHSKIKNFKPLTVNNLTSAFYTISLARTYGQGLETI